MSDSRSRRRRSAALFLAALLGVWLGASRAAAHDIPDEIHLHGFVKPEGDRVHFLVRIPLTLLLNIDLPKRGPGFIDLAYVDERLGAAMAAAGKDLVLFENGVRLTPLGGRARISLPSDRSFETYEKALALIAGSPLPKSTDVFWNQGYFDAHLEYPIRSARSDFAFHLRVAPGLGPRLKMALRFLTPDGNTRAYLLTGGTARTALDPRWHQAARVFVKAGFLHILEGLDHLLFLLCLVIPFRLFTFGLLAVVTSFTVAHSITLIAASLGAAPAGEWFPPLVETLIAASIV